MNIYRLCNNIERWRPGMIGKNQALRCLTYLDLTEEAVLVDAHQYYSETNQFHYLADSQVEYWMSYDVDIARGLFAHAFVWFFKDPNGQRFKFGFGYLEDRGARYVGHPPFGRHQKRFGGDRHFTGYEPTGYRIEYDMHEHDFAGEILKDVMWLLANAYNQIFFTMDRAKEALTEIHHGVMFKLFMGEEVNLR